MMYSTEFEIVRERGGLMLRRRDRPLPPDPETLRRCKEIVAAMPERDRENIEAWAERLAFDVANAND